MTTSDRNQLVNEKLFTNRKLIFYNQKYEDHRFSFMVYIKKLLAKLITQASQKTTYK